MTWRGGGAETLCPLSFCESPAIKRGLMEERHRDMLICFDDMLPDSSDILDEVRDIADANARAEAE